MNGIPTISILSSTRPVIHDVTDIDENSSAGLIEHPVDTDHEQTDEIVEEAETSPLISEVFGTEMSDLPISNEVAENEELKNEEDFLGDV